MGEGEHPWSSGEAPAEFSKPMLQGSLNLHFKEAQQILMEVAFEPQVMHSAVNYAGFADL